MEVSRDAGSIPAASTKKGLAIRRKSFFLDTYDILNSPQSLDEQPNIRFCIRFLTIQYPIIYNRTSDSNS